jgi:hypothetical protein
MKQLITTGYNLNSFGDFRDALKTEYEKKNSIVQGIFNIVNGKPLINNTYYPPSKSLVLMKTDYGSAFSRDTILIDQGYIVDEVSLPICITKNKPTLLTYLRRYGVPVPEFSMGASAGENNVFFNYDQDFIVNCKDTVSNTDLAISWHGNRVNGFVVYYYLFKPMFITKVSYRTKYDVDFKIETPTTCSYGAIKPRNPENIIYTEMGVKTGIDSDGKSRVDSIPDMSLDFMKQIDKIPKNLGLVSCEVILGLDKKMNLKVLNVIGEHETLTERMVDDDDKFIKPIMERFFAFMREDE